MAKEDFCFTYYDGDAARDKAHMNRLERGAYDDIISAQRKRGHLSIDDIKKVLGSDFDTCWSSMEWVLIKDEAGKFFIEWVDKSLEKMRRQSEKQKENVAKRWNKDTSVIPNEYHGKGLVVPLVNGDGDVIEKEEKGVQGEKHLVPEMITIFKKHVPGYQPNKERDYAAVFSIAKFISEGFGNSPPHEIASQITAEWEDVCKWIAEDGFYKQKTLQTISRYIQEVIQKKKNGDQSKSSITKPANEQRTEAYVAYANRYD